MRNILLVALRVICVFVAVVGLARIIYAGFAILAGRSSFATAIGMIVGTSLVTMCAIWGVWRLGKR